MGHSLREQYREVREGAVAGGEMSQGVQGQEPERDLTLAGLDKFYLELGLVPSTCKVDLLSSVKPL